MGDTVKVAVRVRPFNTREMEMKSKLVVRMNGKTTYLLNPETGKEREFAFDYSFWSNNPQDKHFVPQNEVFEKLGKSLLDNAFEGYNCTIFAYGQTGSGKSFTMVGGENNEDSYSGNSNAKESKGLIPRLCEEMFRRVNDNNDSKITTKVEASMLEIYNEKLHDLLNDESYSKSGSTSVLKIRESPTLGPYVEGLSTSAVSSFVDLSLVMAKGTKNRTIGATSMNRHSSRAHTVVTIVLTQTTIDEERMTSVDRVSRINLVDLAGSERQGKTDAVGDRLKEGSAINKSLSALGKCIIMIAGGSPTEDDDDESNEVNAEEKNEPHTSRKKGEKYIPFRDSSLTWLLSESLGGNAKTIMIATISPADYNYQETLSTLKYAWQAKQIKTRAVVNEDPNDRLIRELREEIMLLRSKLSGEDINLIKGDKSTEKLREQLRQHESMIENLNKTWEQKLRETQEQLRASSLGRLEGSVDASSVDRTKPFLLNLHEDPALSRKVAYPIENISVFGQEPSPNLPTWYQGTKTTDISATRIKGVGIQPNHCFFEFKVKSEQVFVTSSENGRICVNGIPLKPKESQALNHNDRIILGMNHVFVFSFHPETESLHTTIDWAMAMEEMLAGMQQKLFDPNEKQQNEDQLNEKLLLIQKKEKELEAQKEKYNKMLEEIDNDYQKANSQHENKKKKVVQELQKRLSKDGRLGDLQTETEKALSDLKEQDFEEMGSLSARKREIIKMSEEIDKILQTQNEKVRIFKQIKEVEARELMIAEEQVIHLIPFVDEANLMSQEMKKGVKFEVRILSSVSPEIFEDPETGEFIHKVFVEAAVRVTNSKNSQSLSWDYDKFMARFYLMQEEFENFQHDPSTQVTEENDAFYDNTNVVEIGKAHLWLMGLLHLIDTEDSVPIISNLGKQQGKLEVKILVADQKGRPNSRLYKNTEGIESLLGKRLDLLVSLTEFSCTEAKYTDVFAKFKFWQSPQYTQTPAVVKKGATSFNFQKHFVIEKVDKSFISFLQSDALTVEVWGTPPKVTIAESGPSQTPKKENNSQTSQTSQKESAPTTARRNTLSRSSTRSIDQSKQDIEDRKEKDSLKEKLEQMEKERIELLQKIENLEKENKKISVYEKKIEELETENTKLKTVAEEAEKAKTINSIRSPASQFNSPPASLSSRPSRNSTGSTPPNYSSYSYKPSAMPPAPSKIQADPNKTTAKSRLETMKKRFGS